MGDLNCESTRIARSVSLFQFGKVLAPTEEVVREEFWPSNMAWVIGIELLIDRFAKSLVSDLQAHGVGCLCICASDIASSSFHFTED